MTLRDNATPIFGKTSWSRRQQNGRRRRQTATVSARAGSVIQPGQLASPLLKFGFPSLSLH